MPPATSLLQLARRLGPAALLVLFCALPVVSTAVPSGAASAPTARPAEEGTRWNDLAPAQKAALKPLERDWGSFDARRKRKWLDIATRMPRMAPEERARIQARMTDWAGMTPIQRAQARVQFKEAEQVAPKGRQAQWEAYQALSADQKRQLAGRAARANAPPAAASSPRMADAKTGRTERAAPDGIQQKSNIVPNPALAARPKAVAPVVVQAAPGATTTLLSKRATPPAHQQAGLPKIAGSSNFIDPSTLLPQRGPQGAAITAAVASAPLPRP